MRAIIDSVHSQVPRTMARLGELELVISLDSHLDVSLGGDDDIYPSELKMIAGRTGAHTAIRRLLDRSRPGTGELVVAIPQRMLLRHAQDVESSLPRQLREPLEEESVSSVTDFLRRQRGIEVVPSPPANLLQLIARTKGRKPGSWLLDLDVDYMQEMQGECYTRILNPGKGVLQSAAKVLELIRAARPEVVVVSEAKVSAIRDPRSNFTRFMAALKEMGCSVEEDDVAPNDAEIVRGISDVHDFYTSVSKRLLNDHIAEMMRGDFDGFRRDERRAADEFFRRRGYAMPA